MRRSSSRLAVGIVLFVLGFLVVVQLRSQSADEALSGLSVQELTELVANVTARNNQLRVEIRALEAQRAELEAAVERGGTLASQTRSDLARIQGWAGVLGVTGAGVRVTVRGPIPGDALGMLLNELRNAGSEAIAIADTRVVPGVVADGPAGEAAVGGIPMTDPIEIVAIGQPQTLAGSLTRAGGLIAQLAARFPAVTIAVSAQDRVSVPPTDRSLDPVLGRPRL
jgi:uncharacterized protein YlxW (UPF0749 family)